MIESVNNSAQAVASSVQNLNAEEKENTQRAVQEQQQTQSVAQSGNQDSVTIRSEVVNNQEDTARTSITDANQARETASRVANLFQQQPELAATAQGGNVTPEKVDAYLTANLG